MAEYKEYREAMKSFRRTQNFARNNFAFPFVIPALAKILPGIKIAASLILLFTFAKDAAKLIFQRVPYFFSRLREYKEKSKDYVRQQEHINKMRDQVMRKQKKLLELTKDIGRELADILQQTGVPRYKEMVVSFNELEKYMESPEFQAILNGEPITQDALERQSAVLQQFMKSYDEAHPEKPQGFIRGVVTSLFPAAGYLAGGPEAMNALSAKLIAKTPELTKGSLAQIGVKGTISTLGVASKVNSLFFSLPMVCVTIGAMAAEGIADSTLNNKVKELANTMANGGETLQQLAAQDAQITQTINAFKQQFNADIAEAKQVLIENAQNLPSSTRDALIKNLTKLETHLNRNFSAVTEAAGTLVKTGVNLLKNKTFDTAMLGLIAGMAIEKYKNKKEEELANKLLAEEAAKMKKFKFN